MTVQKDHWENVCKHLQAGTKKEIESLNGKQAEGRKDSLIKVEKDERPEAMQARLMAIDDWRSGIEKGYVGWKPKKRLKRLKSD